MERSLVIVVTPSRSRQPKPSRTATAKPRLAAGAPLIELKDCSLILDDHPVLDAVSFTLRHGERWALVGPNGSGKSMLLKLLRGDIWPTPTGRERRAYHFEGEPSLEPAGNKEWIAYVGPERQDKYVRYGWDLTVTQVVTTGLFDEDIPLTRPTSTQRLKVERLLRRFSLWGLRNRHILSLSYGQRRLALVARAFASKAQVLLLDEVFNGLDLRAKHKLQKALELPRSGHDWIVTSHRPAELPVNVTHVARIRGGKIIEAGPARRMPRGGRDNAHEHAQAAPAKLAAKRFLTQGTDSKGITAARRVTHSALAAKSASTPAPTPRRAVSATAQRGIKRHGLSPLVTITQAHIYRDYRPVIRDLNWTLQRGEHWAVLGGNGSGKSTLLSMIYGDLHPALGGRIERQGVPAGTRIEEWKRRVGWLSPELQANYFVAKSVEEIVVSGRYASIGLNDAPTRADRLAAARWLKFFGIGHLRERKPRQLSYGQMRLALIARAMANDPELLLLDEPCTGLDGDVRQRVLALIERLAQGGTQIVMAVHDAEDIVPAVCNVLTIEKGGKVKAQTFTSAS